MAAATTSSDSQAIHPDNVAVVPGLDGQKMSKSYNNTIEIFDDPAVIRKKVKKFVTDSAPVEAPKNPDTCPLSAFSNSSPRRTTLPRSSGAIVKGASATAK